MKTPDTTGVYYEDLKISGESIVPVPSNGHSETIEAAITNGHFYYKNGTKYYKIESYNKVNINGNFIYYLTAYS
jgi:hypothetical protein